MTLEDRLDEINKKLDYLMSQCPQEYGIMDRSSGHVFYTNECHEACQKYAEKHRYSANLFEIGPVPKGYYRS
jgi:hypothetical protein